MSIPVVKAVNWVTLRVSQAILIWGAIKIKAERVMLILGQIISSEEDLSKDCLEPLFKAIESDDKEGKIYAITKVGVIGKELSEEALVGDKLLEELRKSEGKPEVQKSIADSLGNLENEKVVEKLLESFKEESRELRLWSAVALGEMGVEVCEDPLIRVLESEHPALARRAGYILGLMGSEKAKKAILEKEKGQKKNG